MDQVKFGRQSLKILKGYGLLEAAHTLLIFLKAVSLPQILLGLFLNTLFI